MSAVQLRQLQREQRQFQRRSGQVVASDEAALCVLLRYRRHSDSDKQPATTDTTTDTTAAATVATATTTARAGATSASVKLRRRGERQQRPQSTAFEMNNVRVISNCNEP